MRRIVQTRGNCWSVCLACILDVPEENVPDFHGDQWFEDADKWLLSEHNLGLMVFVAAEGERIERSITTTTPTLFEGALYIAGGPPGWVAPECRVANHACVYSDGELVYDPHPMQAGLQFVDHEFLLIDEELRPVFARVLEARKR